MASARWIIVFVTLLFTIACSQQSTEPVATLYGPVIGVVTSETKAFRSIPYAAPPIGELRWQSPQPPTPWDTSHNANEYGPACWQPTTGSGNDQFLDMLLDGSGMGRLKKGLLNVGMSLSGANVSEDCLTLSIISPLNVTERLPVMFWIHGGGHQFGGGGQAYESASLVNQGVILVNINYRLGLYGFFAHPDLAAEDENGSTGNYGMLDQLAALQWVQDNIENFGGDPNNVTIFGESAGAHSVGQLMASPLSKGLFHRAIAQSGTGFYQFQSTHSDYERDSGYQAGVKAATIMNVEGDNAISSLRALTTEQLQKIAVMPELSATYHPQIDGYVLPKSTGQIFAEGRQMPVPLIVGSNADEGSVLYYLGLPPVDGNEALDPRSVSTWESTLDDAFGVHAPSVLKHYQPESDDDVVKLAETMMTDSWFGRHAYYMAGVHGKKTHPAYLYFYERRPPPADQTIGAAHALDINHVFGGFLPLWPSDERDVELTTEMQRYWTQFARTGNPNHEGAQNWSAFGDSPREMVFGHERTADRAVDRQERYEAMRAQQDARVAKAAQ